MTTSVAMADKKPPQSAEELLQRYADGERVFRGANLSGANLENAYLRQVDLFGANLESANFASAKLEVANLMEVHATKANFASANFASANLNRANLEMANLQRTYFQIARLQRVHFKEANLQGAILYGANLRSASFQDAYLVRANLEDSDLRRANLCGSNLDGANFTRVAVDENTDLLTAKWQTLIIGDKTYHREAVERGQEILPFGMGNPLKFIFGIDRELSGDDLSAIRKMVRGLEHAEATSVFFKVTGNREELLFEGRGPATEAGKAASLLLFLPQICDRLERIETSVQKHREEDREAHGQQLVLAAKEAANSRQLLDFVKFLYLKEIELRNDKEVERFKKLIDDMRLQEYFGVSGTTIKILKASTDIFPAIEPILTFFGYGAAATALKAGSEMMKTLKTTG